MEDVVDLKHAHVEPEAAVPGRMRRKSVLPQDKYAFTLCILPCLSVSVSIVSMCQYIGCTLD
jgi:hypothetical protein